MSGLRRGFLAVVPPPAVLAWTDRVVAAAPPAHGLRWTPAGQRHVTLQFLGPVDDRDHLVAAVATAVHEVRPFQVQLGGAGAFPTARRASVLWLGVHEGREALGALAATVGATTAMLGFAVEDRAYRAHLTVARASRARDLRAVVEALASAAPSPSFAVERIVLFESDTRAEGAVHTPVAELPLHG